MESIQTDRLRIHTSNSPKFDCIPLLDLGSHVYSHKALRKTAGVFQQMAGIGSKPTAACRTEKCPSFTPRINRGGNSSKRSTIGVSRLTGVQLLQILKPKPNANRESHLKENRKDKKPNDKSRSPSQRKEKSLTPETAMRRILSERLGGHNFTKVKNIRTIRNDGVLSNSPEKRRTTNSYSSLLINRHSPFLGGTFETGPNHLKTPGQISTNLMKSNPGPSLFEKQFEAGSDMKVDLVLSSADHKQTQTHLTHVQNRYQNPYISHSARKILGVVQNFQNHANTPKPIRSNPDIVAAKKNDTKVRQSKQDTKPPSSRHTRPQVIDSKTHTIMGTSSKQVLDQLGYMQSFTERIMQRAKRVTNLL